MKSIRCLIFSISTLFLSVMGAGADSDNLRLIPKNIGKVSVEALERGKNYSNATTAMKYLAAICIRNRKNFRRARQALDANGYIHVANTASGAEYWVHPKFAPIITLKRDQKQIDGCNLFLGIPARKIGDLEQLLDDLIVEDIQRIGKDIGNFRRGEKGWVLRPGFEHAVFLMSDRGQTVLRLSRLDR